MTTTIPPSVLSGILASRSSPETIAALLNETEWKYSSLRKKPHWNARRVYPFWKICLNCNQPFATRNLKDFRRDACGPECKGRLLSKARAAHSMPLEDRKGRIVPCASCGKETWKPDAWIRKAKTHVCSYKCNGVFRGAEWKAHAHKGRKNWTPTSEKALVIRMMGETNPAWKGGLTYRKRKGAYADQPIKYVRCPEAFLTMARRDGYVMEHRLVVALAICRPLLRMEVVHHKNHKATENQPGNLMLFATNAKHKAYEHGAAMEPLWCGSCHSGTSARSGACACQRGPSSPSAMA